MFIYLKSVYSATTDQGFRQNWVLPQLPVFASNEIISMIKCWYQIKAVYDNE